MATNVFFQNYNKHGNQSNLLDDLVIESIRMFGVDVQYVTRALQHVDQILNEDDLTIFDAAYEMEMYVKSVDGFAGEGDFLSKFGLQIRDQVTFTVANRTFQRYVSSKDATKTRPKEGDLIYFPMNDKFFEIVHVEHESTFYQLGGLYVYDLKCELFEYSNERFETGLSEIDRHFDHIKTENIDSLDALNAIDPIAKNLFFEQESDDIVDFSENDPFAEAIASPSTVTSSGGD
jgi:hypothetical protein